MKVSIIIPVYNVSKYIERCLLSALNQVWQDLEIILVDDCTPDDSMEIAERVVGAHTRGQAVTFLKHDKNRGLSAARNTGLSVAGGEYVYFLDSDDYIPANCIELLALAAIRSYPDFVIGNYEVVGAERWAPVLILKTGVYESNDAILSNYVHDKWYVMAWNKLVNRSFLLQYSFYFLEGIVHEDDLWSFKLACTARKMAVVNEPTYYYYMQPDSIMRAPSVRNLECRVEVIRHFYDFILEKGLINHRLIYLFFERSKARYFDRILYFVTDAGFRYQSYLVFREKKYVSSLRALFRFFPGIRQAILNLHYGLPPVVGYHYYKGMIKLFYYGKVLSVKVKRMLRKKR